MGSLSDFFFGQKEKFIDKPTMDPQQMGIFQQLLGGLGGGGGGLGTGLEQLMKMLKGEGLDFSKIEEPARRQFKESTIPGLAERFSALGSGAQGSSAFGQTLGRAGADLESNLAAQRSGMVGQQQQAGLQGLMSLLGLGIGTPTSQSIFRPGTTGFLGAMAPGIGMGLGGMAGGGAGAGLSALLKLLSGVK